VTIYSLSKLSLKSISEKGLGTAREAPFMIRFCFQTTSSLLTKLAPAAWALSASLLALPLGLAAQDEPQPPTTEFGSIIVRQNDHLNTNTSLTMFRGPGGTLNWEPVWLSSSRADYFITLFHDNDFETGTMIGSVTENGRNNTAFGDGLLGIGDFRATVSVAATPTAGQPTSYRLATSGAFAPGPGDANGENGDEVNINVAFAYFPYNLWIAGNAWIFNRANGARVDRLTGTPGLELGTHLTNPANGVYQLDLRSFDPEATSANGIVLVSHAKDEDNFASSIANADGTFTLRIKDNGSNGTGTEQDPVTFVYVPKTKVGEEHLLAMGRVRNNGSSAVKGGNYTVTNPAIGTWHLTIPDQNPNTGTLIISPGGAGNMADNLISYQWNSNGYWVVQACDIISATTLPVLENGGSAFEEIFSFVFFAAPQIPEVRLTSPQQGDRFSSPASFTVRAEASDFNGNVERVQFFRNNRFIGQVTEEPYEITESGLPGGYYIYQARAIDDDGLAPYSTPVSVRVGYDPLDPPPHTALFFDGLTEHARTLVVEPALGVGGPPNRGFTLECWFRKEGAGATASSGSGGIVVHPLMAKGRGESDNNPTDCNYLVGVTMDGLLAADFEAFPTPGVVAGGANFPVYGTHDPIENGRWYHAAVTYDGVKGEWNLYLDGELVGSRETVPGAMPRYDSNHAFAIGAAMNTSTQRAGSFFGAIDEVRVWNYARTETELVSTKDSAVQSATGLVGRFGLDEGDGEDISSSSGGTVARVFGPGVVDDEEGGTAVWEPLWIEGAPLTNQAPFISLTTPQNGNVFVGATPFLIQADAWDADGEVVKVQFFDGDTLLVEFEEAPYQFLWTGAGVGVHRLRAVAEDDAGALSIQDIIITVRAPSPLLLTEVQSAQSANAPAGAADYWELTNLGAQSVSLTGYTWHDSGRNRQAALAWALPAGTSIAAGESIVFTTANVATFRAWWGLADTVRVIQSVGAPGLGQNDGIALFDEAGNEVFFFSYAPGGFVRSSGLPALGGHAGTSGGGAASDALVWDPTSGLAAPRYLAASEGVNGNGLAATGGDVGSPGSNPGTGADPTVLLTLNVSPASFLESAANPAAVGTLRRYGDVAEDLVVALVSGDVSEAMVPATVVIPAGHSSVSFDVTAVDDILADGNQQVMIAATALNVSLASFTVTVLDDGDLPPPALLLTEIQSNQSADAAVGAADYFEITNYGAVAVNLEGFTWDDDSRSFATGQAWAFPAGTSIAAGESVVITSADPAAFRAWWGLDETVQVLQTVGSPGLGQGDGIAFFDHNGRELFYVTYAAGGFVRPDGSLAIGGHAGVSGGGIDSDALVWDVSSGVLAPRYVAAEVGVLGAFQAATGSDVGSPGSGALDIPQQYTLQLLHFGDAEPVRLALDRAPLLAAMSEAYAGAFENTLTLAGGDSFILGAFLYAGADPMLDAVAAIGKTALARPEIALLNLIGVDASAVGVHEWDLGSEVLVGAIQPDEAWGGAQFPILAANLNFTADGAANAIFSSVPFDGATSPVPSTEELKGRLAPMAVVEKGGEKIGLVGVTTQMLEALSSPSGTVVAGATENDLNLLAAQVQACVDEFVDEGINKIVLLSHLRDVSLEQALAGRLRGVDIILAAGVNAYTGAYPVVTQDQLGEPMLIVGTGSEFGQLGRLVVDFDLEGRLMVESLADYGSAVGLRNVTAANAAAAWGVTTSALATTAFAPGTKGAAVAEVTAAVRAVWEEKESVIHGYTAVFLDGGTEVWNQETQLGNLSADANVEALRLAVGASTVPLVGVIPAATIRTPIGAVTDDANGTVKRPPLGEVSVGKPFGGISQLDVESALRLNHGLMTFETSPQGLKTLLEHGVAAWPNQAPFPQVSGVMFAWDPARPAGDRITSMALVNADGSAGAALFKEGPLSAALLVKAPPVIQVVTVNALANGGMGYPAKSIGDNFRYLLANGTLGPVIANKDFDFLVAPQLPNNASSEQVALATFLQSRHGNLTFAFRSAETEFSQDERIQNLMYRTDTVPPVTGTDSDGDGLSDLDELAMGGNPFAAMRVGDFIDLDLSVWLSPGQIARLVGKLPAGLRFDPTTGRLSGVITGRDGSYDLQLQLLEGRTVVGTVALPLAIGAFPARLLAGYEALLETAEGQPFGIARLAVTKPGAWTGNVNLLGQPRRTAKGTFALHPGEQQAVISMVFKATRVLPELRVTLNLDADSAVLSGDCEDGVSFEGEARGVRLAGFGASPPLTRRLNVALDAGPQDGIAYPAGIGWGRGNVNKSGTVMVKGQLGDAQAATFAMKMAANGQALMWAQPYRNKASFFGGVMDLPDLGQPEPATQRHALGATWFKAADVREKSYADGFAEPLQVNVLSEGFISARNALELGETLGLTDMTLNWEVEGGGLSNGIGSLPTLPLTFDLQSNFSLRVAAPADSVVWKGKLGKADGSLTGTLTLPLGAEHLAGKAAVSGVLLPTTNGVIGTGLIRVPVAGVKGAFRTSSILLQR